MLQNYPKQQENFNRDIFEMVIRDKWWNGELLLFQFSDGFGGDASLGVAAHGSMKAALGVIGVKFLDVATWSVNNRLNVLLISSTQQKE